MRLQPHTAGYASTLAREALTQGGESSERIVPLAAGLNSHAYLVDGDMVVKVSRWAFNREQAKSRLSAAYDFYNLLKRHHGDSALDTSFSLATDLVDSRKLRLTTVQRFVEGQILSTGADFDPEQLVTLFEEALIMFERTKKIGDFACTEGGFFDPFQSDNVIVRPNGEPILTDVDTGKIQGSLLFGPVWNRFIANGVRKGLDELREVA